MARWMRHAVVLLGALTLAQAKDPSGTLLVAEPALSRGRLAFAYANDLWTAKADGSDVRQLTTHAGVERSPRFSPDGRWIAFTGRYDGNTDVFVVPAEGGMPRRLTYHPGADEVLGFTPDGKQVLFASGRASHTTRFQQLYTLPVEGGVPKRLPVPWANKASLSPDGTRLAYVPLDGAYAQWKHYRGGTVARIQIMDMSSLETVAVPQPEGRCNDSDPCWIGNTLYFRSDREGEFNLYRFDATTRAVTRLTTFKDFPVLSLQSGDGQLVFEQGGRLHLWDPAKGRAQVVPLQVQAELLERRPRTAKGIKYLRDAQLSPSGNRVAIELRGEILTLPKEKGQDRNLTQTPAVHERTPAWSPDGKSLAWFSDAGGEYGLEVAPSDGKGKAKRYALKGAGFYEDLRWAPDGKKVSFTDNARAIHWLDLESGTQTRVDADPLYGPARVLNTAWSPDSAWIAYTRNTSTYFNQIWLYRVADGKKIPVTDGLSDARMPVFDPGGQYLYFTASTDAGPVVDWFSQASADMRSTRQLYLAVLGKGQPTPLAPQSDEEGGRDKEKADSKAPVVVRVDEEGLSQRILALPVKAGLIRQLQAPGKGVLVYLRGEEGSPSGAVQRFDLDKRKEDTLLAKADAISLSGDGKRALVRMGMGFSICDMGEKLDPTKYPLALEKVDVPVDPMAEWAQIYHEAWRINRDYFYDPGFHGADWKAMRDKYAAFLPHVATRNDLNRVMQWLFSELAVGHHRVGGGDTLAEVPTVPGGLLGADCEVVQGRHRFTRIYGGLNWSPELRSPLTEPGSEVAEGEFLLAIDGRPLLGSDNLFARLERTAGRTIELTVGPKADGTGARTVKVVPLESETALRNRAWVEGNLKAVSEATQGRIGYVYMPNTAGAGHEYFKRYFYPQADREGLIIDERYNGGGLVADYAIDLLRRPVIAHWAMRYGQDLKTPAAAIHGPKVMLIDESAGSGGDLLPWMFRKLNLGPLVGQRTWGGLVGILGFPTLLDGGFVTAPNLGIWTEDGFIVENEGVAPDVAVEITPKDVAAGRDPQLEKAIALAKAALAKAPSVRPKRPPFPTRAK